MSPSASLRDTAFPDMQGLLHSGYGALKGARYLLLRVIDAREARAWLADAPVTTADARHVTAVLQVAFSAAGLAAIGTPETVTDGFSFEFREGMAGSTARSRRLGDVGASAPSAWRWGGVQPPDVLLVLLAAEDALDAWQAQITGAGFAAGFSIEARLDTTDMGGREPFGFTDGLSQPTIDWDAVRTPGGRADLGYGNLVAAGEFVLGHPDEYGLLTSRPLVDPSMPGATALPPAADDPSHRDLGCNGSYLVFRELRQDVRGFWRWLAARTADKAAAALLAETMVGRRMDGTPLLDGGHDIRGVDSEDRAQNGFVYTQDPEGLRCPFGAHIRRANPRTGDLPGGPAAPLVQLFRTLNLFKPALREDLVASTRFHRLLRRGREYGAALSREAALQPDAPDPASGLHFISLGANIARQFEFIQNAWLMSAKFNGLGDEQDPLLGNRTGGADKFSMPQANGLRRRIAGLPSFVTVAGGAYFFLPGVRALRFLSQARD